MSLAGPQLHGMKELVHGQSGRHLTLLLLWFEVGPGIYGSARLNFQEIERTCSEFWMFKSVEMFKELGAWIVVKASKMHRT